MKFGTQYIYEYDSQETYDAAQLMESKDESERCMECMREASSEVRRIFCHKENDLWAIKLPLNANNNILPYQQWKFCQRL